jgi:ClpP class serine protease
VTPSGEARLDRRLREHVDTTEADKAEGKVTTTISAGKYKTEGVGPLTDDAKAHMQARIDGYYTDFVKTVARNRGVGRRRRAQRLRPGPRALGAAALEAGMVDGIATLSQVIQKYARRTTETANARTKSLAEAQIRIAAAARPMP